jgi:hypothetical protein
MSGGHSRLACPRGAELLLCDSILRAGSVAAWCSAAADRRQNLTILFSWMYRCVCFVSRMKVEGDNKLVIT